MSFIVESLKYMMEKDNLLLKVEAMIDFSDIATDLQLRLGKEVIRGKTPYNYLNLFKVLLLQQWHQLSDPKMEEALHTRIDFMWFSGFGLADSEMHVPDETTICRFRNKLAKKKLLDKYLKLINLQLEQHNLKVKITEGAIIDATLIEAAVNSRAKPKVVISDRDEDDNGGNHYQSANEQTDVEIDSDAKWLKKGNKSIFGFKEFIVTDKQDGYYEHLELAPANQSEVKSLEQVIAPMLIDGNKPKYIKADKGYCSQENSELLKELGIGDGIMQKAVRNKPLTYQQKQRNKRISKERYIVERTNATTKNIFGFVKTKYIGLAKVKNQSLLIAIAHNLLKAANKITLIQDSAIQILQKRTLSWVY